MVAIADPAQEIRISTLHATRGLNYWSRRPVIRMDLATGVFDRVSSADVPGFIDLLVTALPGLVEHHCSIGSRGGFVLRLRRGTYAPHIIEHVALELQAMIGHDVSYGKTRGGDNEGEYTLVFEYLHEQVGMRAAYLALDIVQRAFAGALYNVDAAIVELKALVDTPQAPPVEGEVFCGITGGTHRAELQEGIRKRCEQRGRSDTVVVDVSPAYLLQAGLPYSRSQMAVIVDANLNDVPERYRDAERARKLVSVLADAVRRGGIVICPAKEWEIQDYCRDQDCRVAIFAGDDDITRRDRRVAMAAAMVRDGRIEIDSFGNTADGGELVVNEPIVPQVAAALAEYLLRTEAEEDIAR